MSDQPSGRGAKRARLEVSSSGTSPLRVEIGAEGQSAEDVAKRVLDQDAIGAGIAPEYITANLGPRAAVLQEWARRLCALGEPVQDEMVYWQGYKARRGEDGRAQLRRQVQFDFRDMGDRLTEEGVDETDAAVAKETAGVAALCDLLDSMLDLYEARTRKQKSKGSTEESERRVFHVVIDINQEGNCKFHDDSNHTDIRLVVPLFGRGPVIAKGEQVNWQYVKEVPAASLIDDDGENTAAVLHVLKGWNARVCPAEGEVASPEGALIVFKGGGFGIEQPCLRRSPYNWQGSDQAEPVMFLITIDHVTEEDKSRLIDLHLEDDGEDGESEEPVENEAEV